MVFVVVVVVVFFFCINFPGEILSEILPNGEVWFPSMQMLRIL